MGGQLLRNRGMTFLGGRFLAKTWDDSFRGNDYGRYRILSKNLLAF